MQEILSKIMIGERIKSLRIEHNLSQSFMADILKISRSNYSQIELGNQFPNFNTLYLIARYYSKSYEWLLHGKPLTTDDKQLAKLDATVKALENLLSSFKESVQHLETELNKIKSR